MASSQDFARLVTARLALYAAATTRAMFGGFGVFVDGMMIGLIAGDVFHLKADDQNRPDFEAAGMGPFTYDRRGKPAALSYWQAPEAIFEDPPTLAAWVEKAHQAARRGKRKKRGSRRR